MTLNKPVAFVAPSFSLHEAQEFTNSLRENHRGFEKLALLLEKCSGIHLQISDKNLSLMAGRLASILRESGCSSYEDYLIYLAEGDQSILQEFINALTTNTTEFFRESAHFDILAKIAPEMLRARGELRIWCSASSTGQEPWTILMTLSEAIQNFSSMNIRLLATDIDKEVLEKAVAGLYSDAETRGIPLPLKQKYFTQSMSGTTKLWRVKSSLANCVTYAPLNLNSQAYPFRHPFDIIFCRNVLIYFDKPAVQKVLGRFVDALSPGGHLFLGHSESGTLRNDNMQSIAPAVYRRKGKE